ncbi:MAG: sulfite exporter TauE/SafE family protein [Alphaproteobacteria bacterium]|nr:sulfite exporter TauE/SafE family protein [Alphaproteobacteria bacterium]
MIDALFAELGTLTFAVAALAIGVSGIVKGFAGFGVAMVGAPVLAVLYSPVEGIATILVLELITAAQLVPRAVKRTEWRVVTPLALSSWLTVPLGSFLLVSSDALLVRRSIAATALIFALIMLLGARYRGRQTLPASIGIGISSGVITGATGMGNPLLILYVLASRSAAEHLRANIVMLSFFMVSAATIALVANGEMSSAPILRGFALAPIVILATVLGAKLFGRVSDVVFRRYALAAIVATAFAAFIV